MTWTSIDFHCSSCGLYYESYVIRREARDNPVLCPECDSSVDIKFPAPTVLSASYPDGTRRKGWADLKETARLKKEKANLSASSSTRTDIDNEIRKMNNGKLLR